MHILEKLKENVINDLKGQYNYDGLVDIKNSLGYHIVMLIEKFALNDKSNEEQVVRFYQKALSANSLYLTVQKNIQESYDLIYEFEMGQNMDCPCLYGEEERRIKEKIEEIIINSRRILDIFSPIISQILFLKREDSFHKVIKIILKQENIHFDIIKNFLEQYLSNDISPIKLLCGDEKGRALRDKLIHQKEIKITYLEYKEKSEKEKLYIEIGNNLYLYEVFIKYFEKSFYNFLIEFISLVKTTYKYI